MARVESMRAMPLILGDRASGGVIAVLTAGFVLLQILASGFACGSAVDSVADGWTVICHGLGTISVLPDSTGGQPGDSDRGCPCATLCGIGLSFAAVAPDHGLGAAHLLRDAVDMRYAAAPAERPTPRLLRLVPPSRGPPPVSA